MNKLLIVTFGRGASFNRDIRLVKDVLTGMVDICFSSVKYDGVPKYSGPVLTCVFQADAHEEYVIKPVAAAITALSRTTAIVYIRTSDEWPCD